MAKFFFLLFFLLGFTQNVLSFSIVIRKPFVSGNNIFEDIFRNLQHVIEDMPSRKTALNTTTAIAKPSGGGKEPQNVFESNKVVELPDGGEKIEKLVEKEYFDDGQTTPVVKKEMTELYRFPNRTMRVVKKTGMNLTLAEDRKIDCIENKDCNSTSYCLTDNKYACQSCHAEMTSCTDTFQCCPGHTCHPFERVCKRNAEKTGSCKSLSDCPKGSCCALNDDGEGECQPYLKEGEDCSRDPFESLFGLTRRNLPNKCSCAPGLSCKKISTFPFLVSETCEQSEKKKMHHRIKAVKSLRRHRSRSNNWRFHEDDDEDFPSLPIPDFNSIRTSFKSIINELDSSPEKISERKSERTTKTPKRFRKTKTKKASPKKLTIMEDEKIRFSPLEISSTDFHPHDTSIAKSDDFSTIHRRSDDSDEDDEIGYNVADKDDVLDFLNDDNEDDDDDDDDFEEENERKNNRRHKREITEKINEKAREATHKVVDGIFDNIMKGVIKSMK